VRSSLSEQALREAPDHEDGHGPGTRPSEIDASVRSFTMSSRKKRPDGA
jgi:hypothetical protein